MWIVFLFLVLAAWIQAAPPPSPPKPLISDFERPIKTFTVGNEKWCLVRCVEFSSLEDLRDQAGDCRSTEAFYKPDAQRTDGGCGAIGCDQLLADVPCCRSKYSELVCQSEVVYRPSSTPRPPTKRARVRAEIVYHPRKSEPNVVIRRHRTKYSPYVDFLAHDDY